MAAAAAVGTGAELPVAARVSQHLKVLRAGLATRGGQPPDLLGGPDRGGALRAYLDGFWNHALSAFKATVEQPKETP